MFQRNKMHKRHKSLKIKSKESSSNHRSIGSVTAASSDSRQKVVFAGVLTDEQYVKEKEKERMDDASVGSLGSLGSLGSTLSNMGRHVVSRTDHGNGNVHSGGSSRTPTNGREYRFMDSGDVLEEGIWVSKRALNWESSGGFKMAGKKQHKYEASIVK